MNARASVLMNTQLPAAQALCCPGGPLALAALQRRRAGTCRAPVRPAQPTTLAGMGQARRAGQHRRAVHPKWRQVAAAAGLPAVPASAFWPALVHAWNSNPTAVMLAAGTCILGVSLSVFLLAAIPTMLVSGWWKKEGGGLHSPPYESLNY